jgi:hypothetical protein
MRDFGALIMKNSTNWKAIHITTIMFGLAVTHFAYYPGLVVSDSSDQFHQAQTFVFSDWHPAIMAFIWSLTNRIIPGPEGFFLLELALYWGGFLLVGRCVISNLGREKAGPVRHILLCVLPFAPFLLNIAGVIWKDILVFGCFLTSLGLILTRAPGTSIWSLRSAVVWGLLIVGSLARYNSIVAAVPLLVLHLWPSAPVHWPVGAILGRGLIAGLAVILVVVGVGKAMDTLVLHATKAHIENSILLFDLIGISHRIDQNLVPGDWSAAESREIRTTCYTPATWRPVGWGDCHFVLDRLEASGIWQDGLLPQWLRAVTTYPFPYLAHRFDYLHTLLWPQTTFTMLPNDESYAFGFTENILFRAIRTILVFIRYSFPLYLMITDGFWMLVSSALFIFYGVRYRGRPCKYYPAFLIAASAFVYCVPLAIVGQAGDYRYVYWTAAAACIAALLAPSRTAGVTAAAPSLG